MKKSKNFIIIGIILVCFFVSMISANELKSVQMAIEEKDLESFLQGWFGYSKFANTYNFRKNIEKIMNRNI